MRELLVFLIAVLLVQPAIAVEGALAQKNILSFQNKAFMSEAGTTVIFKGLQMRCSCVFLYAA
jgi:hypothetical protein